MDIRVSKISNMVSKRHPDTREKIHGVLGDFTPEMEKRALEEKKRGPENCHRLQCQSLFNVADLVNWM